MAKSTAKSKIKDEEIESEEVETEESEDEATEDEELEEDEDEQTEDEDESDDESEEEEPSDDDEDEDGEAEEFDKAFPHIEGDTLEEYTSNVENLYKESSTEGKRLRDLLTKAESALERVSKVVAENPDLAAKLAEEGATIEDPNTPPKDPTMQILEQQVYDQQKKEYDEFNQVLVDQGIDLEADPKLANELNSNLALVRDHVWRSEKRIVGMGEGLRRAWKLMGKDVEDPKDRVRSASKKVAGQSRNAGNKKAKGSDAELTAAQKKIAENWGLDPKKVAKHVQV